MKKIVVLFILITNIISCQNKQTNKENMENSYGWEACSSAPLGYPIEVYRGGFILKDDDFVSLYGGITTGKSGWGEISGGRMDNGARLPVRLEVTWVSYAEDCEYEIATDIDYEKIKKYFDKGVQRRGVSGKLWDADVDEIIAGFAPGGVVVVWVRGMSDKYEIGRYQGKKIKVPEEEIAHLDEPEQLIFDKNHRREIMTRNSVVPLAIQEKNKNKPIPYGLWDRYREKYNWKTTLELHKGMEIYDIYITYLNGETVNIYYPHSLRLNPTKSAIPKTIHVSWTSQEGKDIAGEIVFEEEEIMNAFNKFNKEDELELILKINQANTFITVFLKDKSGKTEAVNTYTKVETWEIYNKIKR